MADIQSQMPVKLTDNTNTAGITAGSALKIDGSAVTQPVSGTITSTPTGTYTVAGTVTSTPTGTTTVIGTGTAGTAATGVITVQGIASGVALPVSGTVTASPTGTYTVTGTVTSSPTGTYTVTAASMTVVSPTAANLKAQVVGAGTAGTADAGVITVQGIASMTALKVDGSAVTQPVSGTITSTPTGTYTVAGTVTSTPTGTYTVTATSLTVVNPTAANLNAKVIGAGTAGTADAGVITIQGIASMTAVKVDGSAVTQPVSGTITSTPTGTYTVAGTVTSTPTGTYTVAGTTTAVPTGTYTVTATSMTVVSPTAANLKAQVVGAGTAGTADAGVLSVQGINNATPINVSQISQTGIVVNYQTSSAVANGSTATLSYTVTAGKTLYLKGIFASSSGAPCKVIVDYGAGPTVAAVGFYSASMPYLALNFVQPPAIVAATVVNIKIQNNAGAAQDVYATLMGEER